MKTKWILGMILILMGCSSTQRNHSTLSPNALLIATPVLRSTQQLTSKEIQEDVDLLLYALENAYVGRAVFLKTQWQDFLSRIKSIPEGGPSDVKLFCKRIDEILNSMSDNHLKTHRCGIREEYRPSIGSNVAVNSIWSYKVLPNDIGIIGISSFPNHKAMVWRGFENNFLDLLKHQALIIDLRGNPGGDDTQGRALAEFLLGSRPPSGAIRKITSKTPETFAIFLSFTNLKIHDFESKDQNVPDYLLDAKADWEAEFKKANQSEYPSIEIKDLPQIKIDSNSIKYKNPIYVLIDQGCGSSCESTLDAIRFHPGVVTIGQNTQGKFAFGNVYPVLLPNSGIEVTLGSHYWEFSDHRNQEKIGHKPDIYVKDGGDALKVAVNLITKEK